jgi:hypothetical protein
MNDSSYFESQTHPYQDNASSSYNLSYELDYQDRYQEILDNLTSSRMLSSHVHRHDQGTKSTTRQAETLRAEPHTSQRIYIETTQSRVPTEVVSQRAESLKIYIEGEHAC